MFKKVRISILFYILILVAGGAWLSWQRTTDWNEPLWVTIFPINGDGSDVSQRYIDKLDAKYFTRIEKFLAREAKAHGVDIEEPVTLRLARQVTEQPPLPPANRNIAKIALWSLKLRHWANRMEKQQDIAPPDIRIFVRYFDPTTSPRLAHSLGINKGMIGVVNAFAAPAQTQRNNVVIAHEMLHTLGASDKYNLDNTLPKYPQGFADPDRQPLYPQRLAEIMGGRIPISETRAIMPDSLKYVVVGPQTAQELRWTKDH